MTDLRVPDVSPDSSTLSAALAYADAGWYVLPVLAGTKKPGSVVGGDWPHKSSRDADRIVAWFAESDHGIAVHVGRSGAVVVDIDRPGAVPEVLAVALAETRPPFQSTRADEPGRGHAVFQLPHGRALGNGTGWLGGAWGDIRGRNGVIIVAPSLHADAVHGGRYAWICTGRVPVLPKAVADLLDDGLDAHKAASPREVVAFVDEHSISRRPELLDTWCRLFLAKVQSGASRHDSMLAILTGAMREARAGYFDAATAVDSLYGMWLDAVTASPVPGGKQVARTRDAANTEWIGLLAWAVAQANAADLDVVHRRVEDQMPSRIGVVEEPIPLDRSDPLPPFPVEALADPLRSMVEAVAEFTQTDLALPGTVGLGVLSACAAGRVMVEVKGGWKEPLSLYGVVSSASGSRKSPVFAAMTSPLLEAEHDLMQRWKPKAREAETVRQIAVEIAKNAERSAAKARGDEDLMADAVSARLYADDVDVPVQPRILADDVTPEALASLLASHGGRIAIMSAEGGIFDTMAGRYANGIPNLDTLLKGHNAEPVRVDRRSGPSQYIEHANIVMMLTIQPSVLTAIARNPTFRGRGLLARFLFALPPNNVGQRKTGVAPMDNDVVRAYKRFIASLALGLDEWASDPARLLMSPKAARLLLDFETELEPRLGQYGDLGVIADWGAKAVGQTVRLAGLLHLIAGEQALSRPVSEDTMTRAITLIGYFIAHAKAAFIAMGTDKTTVDATYVLEHLTRENVVEFTRHDLHVRIGTNRFPKADDLRAALDRLEDTYWIRRKPDQPHPGPGRKPSPTYVTQFTKSTEPPGPQHSVD